LQLHIETGVWLALRKNHLPQAVPYHWFSLLVSKNTVLHRIAKHYSPNSFLNRYTYGPASRLLLLSRATLPLNCINMNRNN